MSASFRFGRGAGFRIPSRYSRRQRNSTFALIIAGLASYVVNVCGRPKKAPLPVSTNMGLSGMGREHVIATLRQHEPELKAAGIVHLRLHGSVARAESPNVRCRSDCRI
jgi:hypothetical protein